MAENIPDGEESRGRRGDYCHRDCDHEPERGRLRDRWARGEGGDADSTEVAGGGGRSGNHERGGAARASHGERGARGSFVGGRGERGVRACARTRGAEESLAPALETSPSAAPLTSPSASARRPIPTHALPAPSVHEELVVLGRASAVLNSGDAVRALSILDTYDARFPHAAMAQEATVLRIESLARMGNAEAARRAGDAFIKENPDTPYAARIRAVIGTYP